MFKSCLSTNFRLPDVPPPTDKGYRKYATGVERALALFETALQEWADYISFLNRLLRVCTSKCATHMVCGTGCGLLFRLLTR